MIYFDTAASYPLLSEVKQTLADAFSIMYANSASSHVLGEKVSDEVNQIRTQLADSIGAYPSEIIFTSGATESNNIALKSTLLGDWPNNEKKHIVTTQIEHKCIFAICNYLQTMGYEITYIKPNKNGIVTAELVKKAIRKDTAMVSVMHVNNELGTINPISEIGQVCVEKDILFHCDAAQSFQKMPIDVDRLNVDVMSFSAHKIGGPKGIGAVYIRDLRNRPLVPVIHGAGQEEGLRGGTIAAPLILGFGKAVEHFSRYYGEFKLLGAKEFLLKELENTKVDFRVNGSEEVLASCLSLTLQSIDVPLFIRENEQLFCLAQGSACSSREIKPSHVLSAIGLSREMAENTLRISFPLDVTRDDISILVAAINKANTY